MTITYRSWNTVSSWTADWMQTLVCMALYPRKDEPTGIMIRNLSGGKWRISSPLNPRIGSMLIARGHRGGGTGDDSSSSPPRLEPPG